MMLAQHGLLGFPNVGDTTPDGEQVFLAIGDDIFFGDNNTTGYGPTPTAGTVFQWDNISAVIQVGATDVVTAPTNEGTPLPKFGIDYNAATGFKPVIVPRGVANSTFFTRASFTTWMAGSSNYNNAISAADACLASLGLTKLKGILINLGVHDADGASTIGSIESEIDSLFIRLRAKYPNVPILITSPGITTTSFHDSRLYAVRYRIVINALTHANVYVVGNLCALYEAGMYSADGIHPNLTGDNQIGEWLARWWSLTGYSKWGRTVLASLYDGALSSTRKTLIDNFVSAQVVNNNWTRFESLGIFVTTEVDNVWVDWSFLGNYGTDAGTFTANSHISTDGSTNHYSCVFMPGVNNKRAGQNDIIEGVKVKVNNSTGGVILFGAQDANSATRAGQLAASAGLRYLCNDLSANDYVGETVFANDSLYSIARSGGTKFLIKNKVTLASAAVSSSGAMPSGFPVIGGYNNAGAVQSRMDGQYQYHFAAKYVDFDLNAFVDDIETLIDNW